MAINYNTRTKNALTKTAKLTLEYQGNRNPTKDDITQRINALKGKYFETPKNEYEFQRLTCDLRAKARTYGDGRGII